jgi:heptosyltransferase-2
LSGVANSVPRWSVRTVEWAAHALIAGTCFALGLRRPTHGAVERLVVLRNGNIGDHVAALAAYRSLRAAVGSGRLTLITSAGTNRSFGSDLLEVEAVFDEIVVLRSDGRLRRRLELRRALAARRPDRVVCLASDKATVLQVLADALAIRAAGVRRAGPFRVSKIRLFKGWQSRNRSFPRESERLERLLCTVGVYGEAKESPLEVRPAKIPLPSPLAAICPGAGVELNHWPAERFRMVCAALLERGWSVVLLGSEADRSIADHVADGLPRERLLDLTGRSTLLEAAGILKTCRCAITNDSALGHIAAAVGTPVVTVFSSRDFPGAWLPDGRAIGLRHRVHCEVCYRRQCPEMACIRSIAVPDVMRAVDAVLDGGLGLWQV